MVEPPSNGLSPEYVAGFFDGEGTVGIGLSMDATKSGWRPRHTLYVRIGHTNLAILEMLKHQFGGSIRAYKFKPGHAPAWGWALGPADSINFLRTICPFLVIKAPEADLAFEFSKPARFDKRPVGMPRRNRRLPAASIEERERLRVQLVKLHGLSGAARFRSLASRQCIAQTTRTSGGSISGTMSYRAGP